MSKRPNPSDFSINERCNQYRASFSVRATVTVAINAESADEAERQAKKMIEDDPDLDIDESDIEDVTLSYVAKEPGLYRVWDGDRKLQVSHLRPGMKPREPDERGF